nr:hypothetical protein [Actinomycetota bacterium]
LPGVIAWRLLLAHLHVVDEDTSPTWFEDLTLGTIFGFGLQLPFFLVGMASGSPLLVFALPVLALVVALATPFGRRVVTLPTRRLDWRASWALTAVILYGAVWLVRNAFRFRPLSLAAKDNPYIDEAFHQALIADISYRFPPEIPYFLGTRLDYHWFVHAQIATSNTVTGLESELMLRVLTPIVGLALGILGLGAVALRLTGRPVAAFIAPALLVVGAFHLNGSSFIAGHFLEPYLSARFVSSPSHSYSVMMSMPAVMLVLELLRSKAHASRLTWLTLTLTLLALSGSKATFIPAFVCGAVAVWVVHLLVHRRRDKTAGRLVLLMIAVTAFAQLVIFGGQSGEMAFAPLRTVEAALVSQDIDVTLTSQVVMTLAILVSWLLYGVGAVGLFRDKMWLDPRAVWMLATIAAGLSVPFLLFRSGLGQLWFSRSVAEIVVLISAWGMSCLLPRLLTARHAGFLAAITATAGLGAYAVASFVESRGDATGATVTSLLLTTVAPFAVATIFIGVRLVAQRSALRRRGVVVLLVLLLGLGTVNVPFAYEGITEPPDGSEEQLFATGGVVAATHVADRSSPDEIVATNVHCLSPQGAKPQNERCDNRNFWIAAHTERRIVVEGWGYTAVAREAFPSIPDPERFEINDAAFEEPSPRTVGRLVETYDVSWLFVAKKYAADIRGLREVNGLLDKSFENNNYVVFRVKD